MAFDNGNLYKDYIKEIEERKGQGLHPKPIDGAELLSEIIAQIKDLESLHREDSLKFFIYNTLPGTTSAATEKAKFLKEIILGFKCEVFHGEDIKIIGTGGFAQLYEDTGLFDTLISDLVLQGLRKAYESSQL